MSKLEDIFEKKFRANPNYELVSYERLSYEERKNLLKEQDIHLDIYGLFKPRTRNDLTVKSTDKETALLYHTLQVEGRIPYYLRSLDQEEICKQIALLVREGILEIEHNGRFFSGVSSLSYLYSIPVEYYHEQKHIDTLSIEAIEYSRLLNLAEEDDISSYLYNYNRAPLTPTLSRLLRTSGRVDEYLGISRQYKGNFANDLYWIKSQLGEGDYWHYWRNKTVELAGSGVKNFKLYISPKCEAMEGLFPDIFERIMQSKAHSFKIANNSYGLLRPDKMVAYFQNKQDLISASITIKSQIERLPSQGVPFTAQLDDRGIVSWAIDPPQTNREFSGHSWRTWIVRKLARNLTNINRYKSDDEERSVSQIVFEGLKLENIISNSWEPIDSLWD